MVQHTGPRELLLEASFAFAQNRLAMLGRLPTFYFLIPSTAGLLFLPFLASFRAPHDLVVRLVFFYLSGVHHVLIHEGIRLAQDRLIVHEPPEQRWNSSRPDDSSEKIFRNLMSPSIE